MKKIAIVLLSAFALTLLSCEMNMESFDSIPFDKAFTDLGAIEALERGAYSRLRTSYSPGSIIAADLQTDYAHAVYGFSNTYGSQYRWTFTSDDSEISGTWDNLYGGIGLYNFIIDGINHKLGFEPDNSERDELDRIQGSAYLMRALSYSLLAERFCGDYEANSAGRQYSGLPLAITYDKSKTPDRSTLEEVYIRILDDLKQARSLLKNVSGAANSTELNIDCVTALEARVYLQMDNYPKALEKAEELIGNSSYALVDSREELQRMWTYDQSPETIFQFYASKTEVAYQWGYYFCSDYYNGTNPQGNLMMPDYIPTQDCLEKYDDEDWRRGVYFLDCSSQQLYDGQLRIPYIKGYSAQADNLVLFSKYPGNPELRTSAEWNYYNTYKVFRLAEMYLIAAEAAARIPGGDPATPLNELRKHRGLQKLDVVTLADVKEERYREMLLEGTRLTDLKRWNEGVRRGAPQTGLYSETGGNPWKEGSLVTELDSRLEKEKGNYMFVWPIPASEIFANQAFAGQQNPGWER